MPVSPHHCCCSRCRCSRQMVAPLNAAYVIMIAGANEISAAAVGLVYLCAVGPSLLCKARQVECAQTTAGPDRATIVWLCCTACSAPYWFHYVRYTTRVHAVAALMAASYTTGVGDSWHRAGTSPCTACIRPR